ncbi:hypothetical protein BH11MYX3_BH11MYX3_20760 [soil metagenome]
MISQLPTELDLDQCMREHGLLRRVVLRLEQLLNSIIGSDVGAESGWVLTAE